MKHLSIEGMDGSGKTTTCRLLSEKTGYDFIEKPLHYLFSDNEEDDLYIKVRNKVNKNPNRVFTSMFYGLGSIYMYEMFKDKNIITDRHLCSNYAWSKSDDNSEVYDLLVKKMDKPFLTVILYVDEDTLINRLKTRDINDSDLRKIKMRKLVYERMEEFCIKYKFPYLKLDTSHLTPQAVCEAILKEVSKYE